MPYIFNGCRLDAVELYANLYFWANLDVAIIDTNSRLN